MQFLGVDKSYNHNLGRDRFAYRRLPGYVQDQNQAPWGGGGGKLLNPKP